jgi:signal transduction histidine kinase/CheY-like chemotaxis protein/ligand-binding sensor domain-containing protein/AraC-like DNA-binding protein
MCTLSKKTAQKQAQFQTMKIVQRLTNLSTNRRCFVFKGLILSYILSGGILADVYSQNNAFSSAFRAYVSHYSTNEGLSHNHVYQIFQDKRGMMWLVVGNGLVMFDGRTFTRILTWPFLHSPDGVKILFEDGDANLWLRYEDETGGILFTLVNTKIQKTVERTDKLSWLNESGRKIKDIAKGHDGVVWYINERNELWQMGGGKPNRKVYSSGTIIHFCAPEQLGSRIWLYEQDRNGLTNCLVGVSDSGQIKKRETIGRDVNCVPTLNDELCLFDRNRLSILEPEATASRVWLQLPVIGTGEYSERIFTKIDADRKRIWHYVDGELTVLNLTGETIYQTVHNDDASRLAGVFDITIDNAGYAWIGTIQGLYIYRLQPERFEKILWTNPLYGNNQLANSTRGLQEGKLGELLINAGNELYVKRDGQPSASLMTRFHGSMYALAIDDEGAVWASMGGIIRYEPKQGRSKSMLLENTKEGNAIWSMKQYADRLWIGNNRGLYYYQQSNNQLTPFEAYNGHEAIKQSDIYAIQPLSEGAGWLWISSSSGLYKLDVKKGITDRYWKGGEDQHHLPVNNIRNICRTEDGIYWLATAEGLLRWDSLKADYKLFTIKDGLPDENVYAVYADKYGFLWLSSDNGIIQFQRSSGLSRNFLEKDGITHKEFNRISHLQRKDGRICFGGLNGVTCFNPADFNADFLERVGNPLVLVAAWLKEEGRKEENILESVYKKGVICLPTRDAYLQLQYTMPFFDPSKVINYQYRHDGKRDGWIDAPLGYVQLSGLPYGLHKLEVRVKRDGGIVSEAVELVQIEILRPWYWQPVTWLLYIVLLVVLAWQYVKYRERQSYERQQILEREVVRRTEKIEQDRLLLEQQAAALEKDKGEKNRFFANISHEFRTPLSLILGPAKRILQLNHLNKTSSSLLHMIIRNGEKLASMIEDILYLSNLEIKRPEVHLAPVKIKEIINNWIVDYQFLARQKGLKLKLNQSAFTQDVILMDWRHTKIILDNLLANAIKFTEPPGQITVDGAIQGGGIQFVVSDTGRGIHPEDLPYIFNRYYQSRYGQSSSEGGTGIGLALSKELAEAMNGIIEVNSKLGSGSSFSVSLPLADDSGILEGDEEVEIEEIREDENNEPDFVLFRYLNKGLRSKELIWIIDDNQDFRLYLNMILSDEGYEVEEFQRAERLLEKIDSGHRPDLIISDVMMPAMDGYQLLRALRETHQAAGIPIILLTARAGVDEEQKGLYMGVDDYLCKPFEEDELISIVRLLLLRKAVREKAADENPISSTSIEKMYSQQDENWLSRLEKLTVQNINNPAFTIDQLAAGMLMGRTIFYQQVRELTGLTPNQYLQEARMIIARRLLENGTFNNVKGVIQAIGLKDEKYFIRLYKKRFGISPHTHINR